MTSEIGKMQVQSEVFVVRIQKRVGETAGETFLEASTPPCSFSRSEITIQQGNLVALMTTSVFEVYCRPRAIAPLCQAHHASSDRVRLF